MKTTLLRGGKIVDGTGGQARDGHVLIDGDRIKALLRAGEALPAADSVIDATGCVVAPGFIDAHSHMDWSFPLDDHPLTLKCFLEQGVTTVVAGNCGFSPAPVDAQTLPLLDRGSAIPVEKPLDYAWRSMGEFLDRIQERKPVLNLAQLVGHATIRIAVASTRRGAMKPDELKNCLAKAQQSLDEGACGLSFGLAYDPGIWSPREEVEAFSAVAAKAKKPVTVHLRAYSRFSEAYSLLSSKPHNLLALQEMIDIAHSTGVSLQVSHAMALFRVTWPTVDSYLGMIEEARSQGVDVMTDAIPYTEINGSLLALLPLWFIARLPQGYKSQWARMRINVESPIALRRAGYELKKQVRLMYSGVRGWEDLSGLSLGQIARKWGVSAMDALLRLCESSNGRAAVLCQAAAGEPGNERHLEAILSYSSCLFETDALVPSKGYPNPAGFGTFPKVLGHYVRQRRLFSVEDAVRRMTSASADRFGLKDRGRLEPGKAADVVVFDPQTISEAPLVGREPAGRPVGIRHVFLNGTHVVKDGTYVAGSRAGRVLRV
jgi:N-acyl-D-amino-acid deacylase